MNLSGQSNTSQFETLLMFSGWGPVKRETVGRKGFSDSQKRNERGHGRPASAAGGQQTSRVTGENEGNTFSSVNGHHHQLFGPQLHVDERERCRCRKERRGLKCRCEIIVLCLELPLLQKVNFKRTQPSM